MTDRHILCNLEKDISIKLTFNPYLVFRLRFLFFLVDLILLDLAFFLLFISTFIFFICLRIILVRIHLFHPKFSYFNPYIINFPNFSCCQILLEPSIFPLLGKAIITICCGIWSGVASLSIKLASSDLKIE